LAGPPWSGRTWPSGPFGASGPAGRASPDRPGGWRPWRRRRIGRAKCLRNRSGGRPACRLGRRRGTRSRAEGDFRSDEGRTLHHEPNRAAIGLTPPPSRLRMQNASQPFVLLRRRSESLLFGFADLVPVAIVAAATEFIQLLPSIQPLSLRQL